MHWAPAFPAPFSKGDEISGKPRALCAARSRRRIHALETSADIGAHLHDRAARASMTRSTWAAWPEGPERTRRQRWGKDHEAR